MEPILEQLKFYSDDIDLSTRYNWGFDPTFLYTIPELNVNIKKTFQNKFEQNVALKIILSNYFRTEPNNIDDLHFWIINEWGRIRNFKQTPQNLKKIQKFEEEIKKGMMTKGTFSTISSLSKLSSFWDCKQYAIYDSRVIFALNWLILKFADDKRYYPTPAGRNEVIANYDMDTIIRVYHLRKRDTNELYYGYREAYSQYSKLMKDWSMNLWTGDYDNRKEYPFYLEMLLFCIADKEIFNDMKDSVNLTIIKQLN